MTPFVTSSVLGPLLEAGKMIIDRVIPDNNGREAAELELLKLTTTGGLNAVLEQLRINAVEAAHPSIFVAGWRPAAGWVGVAGLAYSGLFHPLFTWIASIKGWPAPPPLDIDALMVVLTGMLGIGTLRTWEKRKGNAK